MGAVQWHRYILEHSFADFEFIERFELYEKTKKAYVVVATSKVARYANILLKKDIIED